MSKGHKSGRKATVRSLKVLPPPFQCEIREQLLGLYEQTENGPKKTRIFRQLDAHTQKHGCGKKLLWKSD